MIIWKLNGKIDVMKLMDWLRCQSLLICDSTYLQLMNLISLVKSWNLCLVNTMKFGVINLRMSWFPWIQMIFHAFKTIYLSIKILDSYVQNARLRKKTNNVFIIFFPNMDLHILFLYLHSTPWKNLWLQLTIKSLVLNPFVIPQLETKIISFILE